MVTFGVFLEPEALTFAEIKRFCLEAENLGYTSLSCNDHLQPFSPDPSRPQQECWLTLAALADATSKIRLGPLCTSVSYRNPALVAKMAATLDAISNGRFELGIGAGWNKPEFDAYGIPFPPIGERLQRLREAVAIIGRMWTQEKATWNGRFYYVHQAYNSPKPVQEPAPPIIVGATGDLTLRTAGEIGDGVNIHAHRIRPGIPPYATPEDIKRKLSIVEEGARSAGKDYSTFKKSMLTGVVISKKKDESADWIRRHSKERGMTPEEYVKWSFNGTPDDCIEKIKGFVDAGIDHFALLFPEPKSLSGIRLFAEEVMVQFE
ncbi:MAG: LLM class flavin-dependent oxidoreductase [Candidatus Bathyarchaeia archaeon]